MLSRRRARPSRHDLAASTTGHSPDPHLLQPHILKP